MQKEETIKFSIIITNESSLKDIFVDVRDFIRFTVKSKQKQQIHSLTYKAIWNNRQVSLTSFWLMLRSLSFLRKYWWVSWKTRTAGTETQDGNWNRRFKMVTCPGIWVGEVTRLVGKVPKFRTSQIYDSM